MSNHVTNWDKANQETKTVNESLTAELERYKERVKTFKQRLNVNLSSHEKLIDSQMDYMIRNRCALKQEIESLKQTLSKQVKEKESLLQTFNVFKKESKEKENKNMDKEIELEKKIKELDNIVYKVDVMNTVMHDDSINVNVLPANNICLVYDNLEIKKLEQENDHLFELLLSQDIVHICLKRKNVVEKDLPQNKAQVIAPGIYKLDLEPLSPKVLKNRDAHIDYIKHTRENADILRELVEHVRALRPLDIDLDSVCCPDYSPIGNDQIAKIIGYGDYQMGNVTFLRRNCTLVEAARMMLIFLKAPLFLWAEAVATVCYTQNRSLIRKCHNKTPYELLYNMKPDLSYLRVFGALCYPTNDSEDLGKFKPKADIGIFVGYAPAKKAYRIYNKRTRLIIETIHVTFDELTTMASEQFSSGPGPQLLTPGTLSSGLVSNPPSPTSVASLVLAVIASDPADLTGTPSSTTIDQDAPSLSTSQTP
ncbi:retrovirus-related pol polyprotein from transposon TNT 1-94 [Tanacetum coccineum]